MNLSFTNLVRKPGGTPDVPSLAYLGAPRRGIVPLPDFTIRPLPDLSILEKLFPGTCLHADSVLVIALRSMVVGD